MSPRRSRWVALAVSALMVVATPAVAVDDSTPVTINGGGWGHGIGMPQYGALGQAEAGWDYDEILPYWYTGIGFDQVANSDRPVPDPIRVGSYASHTSIQFSTANGSVEVCVNGETPGSCSLSADVGETWTVSYSSSTCTLKENGSTVFLGSCDITVEWADQPNTRVDVPAVDRIFARGRLVFNESVGGGGFRLTAELPLEEYLYGIAEVFLYWHDEALKAQVVASRTYAAQAASVRAIVYDDYGGLNPACSCHLVWGWQDQAYRGWHALSEGNGTYGANWRQMVDDTVGEVLVYPAASHTLAESYFFSSTGGATENVWDVPFSIYSTEAKYPYLASKEDIWSGLYANEDCSINGSTTSHIRWCRTVTAGQIAQAFGLDELIALDILDTFVSGSPSDIRVTGVLGGNIVESHHTGSEFENAVRAIVPGTTGVVSHFIYSFDGLDFPERLAGADRYATAVAASEATFPGGSDVVYVGTGLNYPDALAGGVGAANEDAPILLVAKDVVPAVTREEIKRLGPSKIVVLGGTGVVSDQVEALLGTYVPGVDVQRRAGPTRFETAVEISEGVFGGPVDTVYVVGGFSFADAVVAAPAAIRDGGPMLLVHPSVIPTAVKHELERLNPSKIVIVGGTDAVPNSVMNALGAYATEVTRISGADRYSVGAAVSSTFSADTGTVYIAVGTDYPDALAGGAISGQDLGPLLLVKTNEIPASVQAELARIGPSRIVILGGTGVVSSQVETELASYIE